MRRDSLGESHDVMHKKFQPATTITFMNLKFLNLQVVVLKDV